MSKLLIGSIPPEGEKMLGREQKKKREKKRKKDQSKKKSINKRARKKGNTEVEDRSRP